MIPVKKARKDPMDRVDFSHHQNTSLQHSFRIWDLHKCIVSVPDPHRFEGAKVVFIMKTSPWSTTDSDALVRVPGKFVFEYNQDNGDIIAVNVLIEVPYTQLRQEPGEYYYSIDIKWDADELLPAFQGKIIQGKIEILPNVLAGEVV